MSEPASDQKQRAPKVYISYSHDSPEHRERVLRFANRLREDGIDCTIDQYESSPPEGWRAWSERQVMDSDFVLIVFTEVYSHRFSGEEAPGKGQGAVFEGSLIRELLYAASDTKRKFIPVIFSNSDREWIPAVLNQYTNFNVESDEDYHSLVGVLTGDPMIKRPALGQKVAPRSSAQGLESTAPDEPGQTQKEGKDAGQTDEEEGEFGPTFDLNRSQFTHSAWMVLEGARHLGESRPRANTCSVKRLLASLMLSGMEDEGGRYTGGWLLKQIDYNRHVIRERLGREYPAIGPQSTLNSVLENDVTPASRMSSRLKETIDLAEHLAKAQRPKPSSGPTTEPLISVRHLLGAAVRRTKRTTNVGRFLKNFGLQPDEIRARMIEELPRWGVDDRPEDWKALLDAVETIAEESGLPIYAADSATGPDLIGITREVEAMASLVSAWSVEPPLSIGLFGEWGSGKSFFMQKMKERVRLIASEARKSQAGQREFGYYKNIVQVEFNAWHYVEGNLWASLVEHIFSNLRLEGIGEEDVDSEEHLRKRLEKLLGEVKEKTAEAAQKEERAERSHQEAQVIKQKAEAEAKQREEEAEGARARAKAAEEEQRKAELKAADKQREADASNEERNSLRVKDILQEVQGSAEIREQVREGLKVFGITDERVKTVQGLRDALNEASSASAILEEGFRILKDSKNRWWLLLFVVAVPLTLVALALFVAWLNSQQGSPWIHAIAGIVSIVGTVGGAVIGFWKQYASKLKPFLDTAANLKKKKQELEEKIEKAREERARLAAKLDKEAQEKRAEAERETRLAEQKMAEAEKIRQEAKDKQDEADRAAQAAESARKEAERLQRDADALLPERRIAAFIADRAGAKDYRRHLGVPALVRRDFEKLSAMFRTQRIEEVAGRDGKNAAGRNDLAIVNRIILYIDDLDRCPPEKVVEVLRAIHLLLAFPLFVVVVAVDARWMKRSLRDRFSLMLTTPAQINRPDDPEEKIARDEELAFGAMTTPDDYLEKLFQVPFWIRPLGRIGSTNLVNALTKDDMESPEAPPDSANTTEPGQTIPTPPQSEDSANAPAPSGITPPPPPSPKTENAGTSTPDRGTPPQAGPAAPPNQFQWRPVEPKPRTLQLTEEERQYMVELASVIGRSPRSVKRYVNCYRLLKSALDREELARANHDGRFRTIMLLLGLVTGLPDIAPALLADLRQAEKTKAPVAWAHEAAKRLNLQKRERWNSLLPAFTQLQHVQTIRPLVEAADLVDRFSFSPVRLGSSTGS